MAEVVLDKEPIESTGTRRSALSNKSRSSLICAVGCDVRRDLVLFDEGEVCDYI
jgi:hypothetical protein